MLLVVMLFAVGIGEVFDGHRDGKKLAAIALLDFDLGCSQVFLGTTFSELAEL